MKKNNQIITLLRRRRTSISSGMNLGVIQWMAIELLKKDSSENHPITSYIVEHDISIL